MSNLAFATSKATAAFSKWQSQYAEVGIPTFPVDVEQKKPMVRGYEKIGIRASGHLAQKPRFREHDGFGFCGKRAGIVIVDIDAPGESILADTLAEYGQTPIIVRTPSGGHHLWFRHSGEGRQIRPDASKPVDILGGGYVVAPPSRRGWLGYEMIQGRLEDVSSLPKCKRPPSGKLKYTDSIYNIPTLSPSLPPPAGNDDERVCEGARNDSLFRAGMGMAKQFRDYETLRQAMLTLNSSFSPPLALDEAQHVVERVWFYQTTGRNFSGSEACAVISRDEILSFPDDHSLRLLLLLKQAHTVRPEPFAISQPEVAELLGIHQSRMPGLIRKLIKTGHIVKVHQGTGRGNPCFYQLSATKNGSLTLASMAPSSRIASG